MVLYVKLGELRSRSLDHEGLNTNSMIINDNRSSRGKMGILFLFSRCDLHKILVST